MTDEIFYEGELNEKRISAYKKLAENYRIQEGTVRDIFSQGIVFSVSRTAAHTAALLDENKRLKLALYTITRTYDEYGPTAVIAMNKVAETVLEESGFDPSKETL